MQPVLIGLTGRRGGGKDTAFGDIKWWAERRDLTAVRRGFADKLKHSAFLALGFQIEISDSLVLADALKDLGEITTTIPGQSVEYTISGRKFLQLYGTEAHRDVFGPDFWVDALLPISNYLGERHWQDNFSEPGRDFPDICVITDCRFENEAQRIRDLGGHVWKIDRPGGEEDGHASEAGLPEKLIDRVIDNSGTLPDLWKEISAAMTETVPDAPEPLDPALGIPDFRGNV